MYPSSSFKIKCIHLLFILSLILTSTSGKSEQKRALIFPPTSLFGTFVAIAVPIDLPNKNVFVSYNFEANYAVVTNITEIDEVIFPNLPVKGHLLTTKSQNAGSSRWSFYRNLEGKFLADISETMHCCSHKFTSESEYYERTRLHSPREPIQYGMKGRECMLRNICEAAETPLHHNGILGHLMHVIFTPSASREEGLDDEYYEAEASGHRGDCDKYVEECPTSLFDYITRLVEFPHST